MEKQKIQTKEPMKPNLANKARVKRVRKNIGEAQSGSEEEPRLDTLKVTHAGITPKFASSAKTIVNNFGRMPVSRSLVNFH